MPHEAPAHERSGAPRIGVALPEACWARQLLPTVAGVAFWVSGSWKVSQRQRPEAPIQAARRRLILIVSASVSADSPNVPIEFPQVS